MILVVVQWLLPISTVVQYEQTKAQGADYYFELNLRDPFDPFRGAYLDLNFAVEQQKYYAPHIDPMQNKIVYAILAKDAQGFARIESFQLKPASNSIALSHVYRRNETGFIGIRLPFKRYYLPQKDAQEMEKLLRKNNDIHPNLLVKVDDGKAMVDMLFINQQKWFDWKKDATIKH